MQSNSTNDLAHYDILKISPTLLIMRHKQTRQTYRYVQTAQNKTIQQSSIANIIPPIRIQTGLLYQTGFMNLGQHIQTAVRSGEKCMFREEEIINTIEPILKTLQDLHSLGETHGAVVPENIVIDGDANLKIYYPGIKDCSKLYYSDAASKQEDDYRALAIIVLQLLGYDNVKHQDQVKTLKSIAKTQKYSEFFIACLLVMLQKKRKTIDQLLPTLMQPTEIAKNDNLSGQAKELYDKQILDKNKKIQSIKRVVQKVQFTPPLIKHSDHLTPRKTLQTTKRYMKIDDTQNKKIVQDSKKKKTFETALKKVSNGKTEMQNTNTQSPVFKKLFQNMRDTKQKQEWYTGPSMKRTRTVSRKKIN